MYTHHFDGPFGGHRHHHHGHRRGPWGSRGGGSPLLPFLAGVFLARAAMGRGPRRFGRHRGRGPWGWGDWAPDAGEEWRGGPPWRRGGWGDGRERARAAMRTLKPEIAGIATLLRDAWHGGTLDQRKVGEIRDVLSDTRRRIAAILSETQPPSTMV